MAAGDPTAIPSSVPVKPNDNGITENLPNTVAVVSRAASPNNPTMGEGSNSEQPESNAANGEFGEIHDDEIPELVDVESNEINRWSSPNWTPAGHYDLLIPAYQLATPSSLDFHAQYLAMKRMGAPGLHVDPNDTFPDLITHLQLSTRPGSVFLTAMGGAFGPLQREGPEEVGTWETPDGDSETG